MRLLRLSLVQVVFTLAGCSSGQPDPQPLSLRGVEYRIPRHDISGLVMPPKDGSALFVRLEPPKADYHLVLDEFSHYLPNKLGPDIPTISRLNDNRFGTFTVTQTKVGPVICQIHHYPHFNCGFRLDDGPVRWSVLFDKERLLQVERIRSEAEAAVHSYRP
jgi:hypothetical protein